MFIGGGTPSLLPPDLLTHLTDTLFHILGADKPAEFTMEANPGTVTEEWISAAVNAGMNRLSLGMQALQPELLDTLGRIHTFADMEASIQTARRFGVGNINIDLIFGIPGQTLEQWVETLDAALSLHPMHISAYGLIPEEGTPLHEDLQSGALTLPDPDLERMMYDSALSILSLHGFSQYEISNFALGGMECRHNIGYWKQVPYVGLGVAAASMAVIQQGKNGMRSFSLKTTEFMLTRSIMPSKVFSTPIGRCSGTALAPRYLFIWLTTSLKSAPVRSILLTKPSTAGPRTSWSSDSRS